MSGDNVYDWKYRIEQLERRKLTEGAVSMTIARPTGPPLRLLDTIGDGIHSLHSQTYFRDLYMQEIPDENR